MHGARQAIREAIPGYDFDRTSLATSPVDLATLRTLEQTVGWTDADTDALKMADEVLGDQAEAMVDSWRRQIAAQPHLARWFFGPDGQPDERYKAAVKRRFVQWVRDTCLRPHDQAWLNYQEEIGLRHTPAKKNTTDDAHTPDVVPLRYLLTFVAAVLDVKTFLSAKGHTPDEVERMQRAWTKNVLLQIALWSRPYVRDGLW
jgi:Protoglobin